MPINFWMGEQHIAAAKAMDSLPETGHVFECNLLVGDMVSFPGFPQMAYRVVSRTFRQDRDPKQCEWLLQIVPVGDPISAGEALVAPPKA